MAEFDSSHYDKMLKGCLALAKSCAKIGDHKKLEAVIRLAFTTGVSSALERALHDELSTEQLWTRFKAQAEEAARIMENEINV